jgi:hypothetical protein
MKKWLLRLCLYGSRLFAQEKHENIAGYKLAKPVYNKSAVKSIFWCIFFTKDFRSEFNLIMQKI